MRKQHMVAGVVALFAFALPASADLVTFTGPDGLSGTADFTFAGSTLCIVLTNTSTGVPGGFSNSDQLLTSLSFNLPGGITITGGTVTISTGSASENFDQIAVQLGGGDDVSGEWGFGNGGATGLHDNFVSANQANTTPFGGTNLDSTTALNGPQGGLTNGQVALGGLGAINNSVTFKLTLSGDLENLDWLDDGTTIEFGSDAEFVDGNGVDPGDGIDPGIGNIDPGDGIGNGIDGIGGPGGNGQIPEPNSLVLLLGGALTVATRRWWGR